MMSATVTPSLHAHLLSPVLFGPAPSRPSPCQWRISSCLFLPDFKLKVLGYFWNNLFCLIAWECFCFRLLKDLLDLQKMVLSPPMYQSFKGLDKV